MQFSFTVITFSQHLATPVLSLFTRANILNSADNNSNNTADQWEAAPRSRDLGAANHGPEQGLVSANICCAILCSCSGSVSSDTNHLWRLIRSGGCSLKKFVRVQKRRGLTPWTALALACIKITSSRNFNLKTIEIKASKLLVKFIKVQSHLDLPGGPPSWHSTCDNSHAVGRYYR